MIRPVATVTPPPFNARERRVIARLRTPDDVQRYLNRLPYNVEEGGETLRSFRGVVRDGTAHCLEAALFAATRLLRREEVRTGGEFSLRDVLGWVFGGTARARGARP